MTRPSFAAPGRRPAESQHAHALAAAGTGFRKYRAGFSSLGGGHCGAPVPVAGDVAGIGFLGTGTTAGFFAAGAGVGAGVAPGAFGATVGAFGAGLGVAGCFNNALTTPGCRPAAGFEPVRDADAGGAVAAGAAVTGAAAAAGAAATGVAAAGCCVIASAFGVGAPFAPPPATALAGLAHGDALATVVAAAGVAAAFLCPNSELILLIADVVLETASAAPL